jgi:RimJ/RimL family protein N-acetyltransferase
MNWIPNGTRLNGETVELIPLDQSHIEELVVLSKEKRIFEFYSYDFGKEEKFREVMQMAFIERDNGRQYPFVIYHKAEKKIIGSTRLMEIVPEHKKLEIGFTWLHPNYWACEVNPECKLLLLTYCFEELGANRVHLKTDVKNMRSRKAIEKIGAQYEGVLRQDWIKDDGTFRDSIYFSILKQEWEEKKNNLKKLYHLKKEHSKIQNGK